jgi:hypothetical protein
MRIIPPKSSRLLSVLRDSARQQGLNPYRIAKSSGLPLTTVQRLLTIKLNVPLRNVEMLMEALGLNLQISGPRKPAKAGRPAGRPASAATKAKPAKRRGRPKSRRA